MYRMPSRPSRHRVALWRDLHRLAAVNLLHATWAVPHGEGGPPDLSHLLDIVTEAGGSASAAEVVGGRPIDDDLCDRLVDACDQLWDGFINEVDELEFALADTEIVDGQETADELAVLRDRFADLVVHDLVQSGASVRAACKLTTCVDRAANGSSAASDPVERARRHHVELLGSPIALTDGSVRCVAGLAPTPSIAWERELLDFESAVYRPDSTRAPITHGIFVWTCSPVERQPRVDQLQSRIRRFEQSLVD
jgi:hypothetical protein